MIEHVPVSEDQREEFSALMVGANNVLTKGAELAKKAKREFRGEFFNGLHRNILSQEEVDAVYAVKAVENAIVHGYVHLVNKLAITLYHYYNNPSADLNDYVAEGYVGLLNAIYAYDGRVSFITFAYISINNEIKKFITTISPVSSGNFDLINKFQEEHDKTNISIREFANRENLTKTEINLLKRSLVRVFNKSDKDMAVYEDRHMSIETYHDLLFLRETIDKMKLSAFERDVIDGYLSDDKNWSEKVANRHINKRSGKNYTRQNCYLIVEKLIKKMKRRFKVAA